MATEKEIMIRARSIINSIIGKRNPFTNEEIVDASILDDPRIEDIKIEDIAHDLALEDFSSVENRFNSCFENLIG